MRYGCNKTSSKTHKHTHIYIYIHTHTHIHIHTKVYVFKNVVCYEIYCDVVPVLCLPVKWCNNVTNEIIMIRDKHTTRTSCYKGWVNVPCVIKFNRMMKYRIRKGKTTMIAKHSPRERKFFFFLHYWGLWNENLNSHVIHCKCVFQWPNQLIRETIQMPSI